MAEVVAWARRMRSKNSDTSLDNHSVDYPVTLGLKQVLPLKMMLKGTDRLDHIKDSVPKQSNPEVSGYDSLLRDYKLKFLNFRTSTEDGIDLTDKMGDALDNTDAAKGEDLNTSPSHMGKSVYWDQLLVCVMALIYLDRTCKGEEFSVSKSGDKKDVSTTIATVDTMDHRNLYKAKLNHEGHLVPMQNSEKPEQPSVSRRKSLKSEGNTRVGLCEGSENSDLDQRFAEKKVYDKHDEMSSSFLPGFNCQSQHCGGKAECCLIHFSKQELSESVLKEAPIMRSTFLPRGVVGEPSSLTDSHLRQAENGFKKQMSTHFNPHYNLECDSGHRVELRGVEAWYKRNPNSWYMEEYWDFNKGNE